MRDLWTKPVMQETIFLGFRLKSSHPKRVCATSKLHLKEDFRSHPQSKMDLQQIAQAAQEIKLTTIPKSTTKY